MERRKKTACKYRERIIIEGKTIEGLGKILRVLAQNVLSEQFCMLKSWWLSRLDSGTFNGFPKMTRISLGESWHVRIFPLTLPTKLGHVSVSLKYLLRFKLLHIVMKSTSSSYRVVGEPNREVSDSLHSVKLRCFWYVIIFRPDFSELLQMVFEQKIIFIKKEQKCVSKHILQKWTWFSHLIVFWNTHTPKKAEKKTKNMTQFCLCGILQGLFTFYYNLICFFF